MPNKRIFYRTKGLGLKTFCLCLIAVLFISSDRYFLSFHRARQNLEMLVLPLRVLVSAPIQWVHWVSTSLTAQQRLLDENAKLKARELLLQSKLQKYIALEHENVELKGLLKSTATVAGHVKVAQFLAVDLDPTTQRLILNKGSREGVYVNQPVFDADGVLGQVVDVSLLTSKVLLVTDPHFAIPVKDSLTGVRAIAVGVGITHHLKLLHVTDDARIKRGDVFVTSGLGLNFPAGYPVGVVSEVEKVPGERFLKVILLPSAHFGKAQQVVLIWPNKAVLTEAVRAELSKPLPNATQ